MLYVHKCTLVVFNCKVCYASISVSGHNWKSSQVCHVANWDKQRLVSSTDTSPDHPQGCLVLILFTWIKILIHIQQHAWSHSTYLRYVDVDVAQKTYSEREPRIDSLLNRWFFMQNIWI